jgi:hypothetical protein
MLIGVLVLLLGGTIYFIDRPPDQTYIFTLLPIWLSGYGPEPRLPIAVSGSLPTFVHALSFSTITASLCRPKASGYAAVCIVWLVIEWMFELGQGIGGWIAHSMPIWIEGIPFLGAVRYYFVFGTFDPLDLLAASLGSSTAFLLLLLTRGRRLEKR